MHAKLMQKVRERQVKPSEEAAEVMAEVSIPCTMHTHAHSISAHASSNDPLHTHALQHIMPYIYVYITRCMIVGGGPILYSMVKRMPLMPGRHTLPVYSRALKIPLMLQEPATLSAAVEEAVETVSLRRGEHPAEHEAQPRQPLLDGAQQQQQQQETEPQRFRFQVRGRDARCWQCLQQSSHTSGVLYWS